MQQLAWQEDPRRLPGNLLQPTMAELGMRRCLHIVSSVQSTRPCLKPCDDNDGTSDWQVCAKWSCWPCC